MTEIEKLYENAGIKGEWRDYRTKNGKIYEGKNPKNRNIRLYKPRLTANKQLELIKWLAIRFNSDYMSYWHNEIKDVWIFRLNDLTELSSEEPCIYEGRNKDFTESLCNLINDLWQDLTDQEKKEIRRILNENS